MKKPQMTADYVCEHVRYEPSTGLFYTKKNEHITPKRRGSDLFIEVGTSSILCKVAAYTIMNGERPIGKMLFKDGDRTNLKWENLYHKLRDTSFERPGMNYVQEKMDIIEMCNLVLKGKCYREKYISEISSMMKSNRAVAQLSRMSIENIINQAEEAIHANK